LGHPYDIEHASDLHVKWCQALMQRAGLTTTHQAGPQMRAVMLELRRSLSSDAVLAIANVLPTLERGIFLEDWDLNQQPDPPRDATEFFDRIYERIKGHHAPVPSIASDVFWVLQNELGPAEAEVVRKNLPASLAELWPD
jgi:uncharacterized protein (DUF2267 family)